MYYFAFCIALLPIVLLRDYTPDNELRYLSIADEALRNRTFFAFTNHGLPYADKPPLYLWFVMLGKWLLGTHRMWFLSLASIIPAIVTTRVMDRWVAPQTDAATRHLAQMMLLTGGLFAGMAVTLRMDMLLCMFIVLSLRSFYTMATSAESQRGAKLMFPLYMFLAVFSKGPLGLLIPLLSTLVYLLFTGRIREFGRYWGWRTWSVLVLCFTVWFACVYAEGGAEYLNNLLFHQTIDRAVDAFHHKEPFYYYGIAVWYSIAPWSLMVVPLVAAVASKCRQLPDLHRFFFYIVITTFVLLSLISSKLQVYLLPAFPFAIYLAVLHLSRFRESVWLNILYAITAAIFISILPLLHYMIRSDADVAYLGHWAVYVASGIMTVSGVMALWLRFGSRKGVASGLRVMLYALTCTIFVAGFALPSLNPWIGYGALCGEASQMAERSKADQFVAFDIRRAENMDVYLGQPVVTVDREDIETLFDLKNTIVMMPKWDLEYFGDIDAATVGKYAVVRADQLGAVGDLTIK